MVIIHSKYNQPQNTFIVNPLSRPKEAYLFQAHLRWMRAKFERNGLLYLEKMMVSTFSIKIRNYAKWKCPGT